MARRSVADLTREVQRLAAEVKARRAEVRSGNDAADQQRIARARADVLAFGEYVFGETNYGFHQEIQRAWDRHDRLLIEAPPDTGKTQQVLRRLLWMIGRNPNIRIGIVTARIESAKKWVKLLATALRHPRYRAVFPHIKPTEPWNTTTLCVDRTALLQDPTVQTVTLGGRWTGAHVDVLLLDDVLTTASTTTPAMRAKTVEWIDGNDGLPRLAPGGRCVVLGNTWFKDDAIQTLAKRPGWFHLRMPLTDPEVTYSAMPERFPVASLRKIRADSTARAFNTTYCCNPKSDEDSIFRAEWLDRPTPIRWSPTYRIKPGERIAIGVDLAMGLTDAHDKTAFAVVLEDQSHDLHVVYVESGRWTGPQIIDRMVALEQAFPGAIFRVESVQAQRYILDFARQKLRAPVIPHFTSGGANGGQQTHKAWGMERVAALAEQGRLGLCRDGRDQLPTAGEALRTGLMEYSPVRHVADEAMALLFATTQLTLPQGSIRAF